MPRTDPHQKQILKVIVMSATMGTAALQSFFGGGKIIEVAGRIYPVDMKFADHDPADCLNAAVDAVIDIHKSRDEGDILCILPGEDDLYAAHSEVSMRSEELEDDDLAGPLTI